MAPLVGLPRNKHVLIRWPKTMTITMRTYSASKQSKSGTRSSAFPAPSLQNQAARQQDADPPIPFTTGELLCCMLHLTCLPYLHLHHKVADHIPLISWKH